MDKKGLQKEVEKYKSVVGVFANKYAALAAVKEQGLGKDDLMQIGMIAVITAIRTYNPNKNATLLTHIFMRVKYAIMDVVRQAHGVTRNKTSTALHQNLAGNDFLTPVEYTERHETIRDMAKYCSQLLPRERFLIDLLYNKDLNLRQAGVKLKRTESRVSQLHKEILAKLKGIINGTP